jgi:hypothetical protein
MPEAVETMQSQTTRYSVGVRMWIWNRILERSGVPSPNIFYQNKTLPPPTPEQPRSLANFMHFDTIHHYNNNGKVNPIPALHPILTAQYWSANKLFPEDTPYPLQTWNVGTPTLKDVSVNYESYDGRLTVSGSGAMRDYLQKKSVPWNDYRSSIRTIEITAGITKIGDYAFDATNIKSIIIPDGLTQIGVFAFSNTAIEKVDIPATVNRIDSAAFGACKDLDTVFVHWTALSSIRTSAAAFDGLTLAEVTLVVPDGRRSMYKAFEPWKYMNILEINELSVPTPSDTITDTDTITAIATAGALALPLYPNPTTGVVYIDNPDGAEVVVYSSVGALVLRTKGDKVDLSKFAAGVYVVRVGQRSGKIKKE